MTDSFHTAVSKGVLNLVRYILITHGVVYVEQVVVSGLHFQERSNDLFFELCSTWMNLVVSLCLRNVGMVFLLCRVDRLDVSETLVLNSSRLNSLHVLGLPRATVDSISILSQ